MRLRIPVTNLGALGENADWAPLPAPDGALYRHPNPDGSRKRCENCFMFVPSEQACIIHFRDQKVESTDICGYHIFGQPMDKWMDHPGMQPVTPDISGLRRVGGGAVCASCRFYRDQGNGMGLCYGVSKPDDRKPPQPVELMGWCARFENM